MAAVHSGGAGDSGLGEREVRMLEFEREWRRHDGLKDEAIRAQFGLSAARYYQLLNSVIDSPAAVRHDPMLVRQLQGARHARAAARASGTFTAVSRGAEDPRYPEESN